MLANQQFDNYEVSNYIGSFLKRRRKVVGLTGAELASRLSISQQQISRYERGVNAITIQNLLGILHALELKKHDIDEFLQNIFNFYHIDIDMEKKLFN
ncbi:helix-turn-helix domain-containing protein [Providencia alcalifaciens]|uniref:helix-turn-helix domain-containing protein n=1 Tax=Providencia alcalifaciens TaxID=126385 RepID=UPI001CC5A185|nr:helix-turn-helix transcriptional regulator [Providencia alcalifaciens]CAG9429817.1 hypothetical protein NVI2019_GHJFPKLH_03097 [Providencia alcalifaciens]